MSLLSNFLANHLLSSLEAALKDHEPELQQLLINEVATLSQQVLAWVEDKAGMLHAPDKEAEQEKPQ